MGVCFKMMMALTAMKATTKRPYQRQNRGKYSNLTTVPVTARCPPKTKTTSVFLLLKLSWKPAFRRGLEPDESCAHWNTATLASVPLHYADL